MGTLKVDKTPKGRNYGLKKGIGHAVGRAYSWYIGRPMGLEGLEFGECFNSVTLTLTQILLELCAELLYEMACKINCPKLKYKSQVFSSFEARYDSLMTIELQKACQRVFGKLGCEAQHQTVDPCCSVKGALHRGPKYLPEFHLNGIS